MKTTTKIKNILFPTHDNGTVGCLVQLEENKDLESVECYGIGFPLNAHVQNEAAMPFIIGSTVDIEFNDKKEIETYTIIANKDDKTPIAEKCSTCGYPFNLSPIFNFGASEIKCRNSFFCTAQSISPVHRLIKVAYPKIVLSESYEVCDDFVKEYPEASLMHLSDIRMFLTSDPNTEPRSVKWKSEELWHIEKAIWNFVNQDLISCSDFWFIGFGLINLNYHPRKLIQESFGNHTGTYPLEIDKNIDRVVQLVKFFDHYGKKTYVS